MWQYVYLCLAIVAEVLATSLLKETEQFTRFGPSLVVTLGYGLAFFALSHVLRTMPVGVAYALWSGAGIVLVAIIGTVCLKQVLDWPAAVGIGLIVAGVVVINLFSRTITH